MLARLVEETVRPALADERLGAAGRQGPAALARRVSLDDEHRAIDRLFLRMRSRVALVGIVAVIAMPVVLSMLDRPSYLTAAVYGLILGMAAISLVVLVGYVGQVSLAQFAFMGIGALTVARLSPYIGYWPAVPIAGLTAVPVGLVAALPALRLRGIYLAIATLGLSQVVTEAVLLNSNIANGTLLHIEAPTLFGRAVSSSLSSRTALYFVDLCAVAAAALFTLALRHRKTGLAFAAVRDSELAAGSVGISVAKYKLLAFALSSFYAGVAGGLYMSLSPDVDPTSFFSALTGSIPLLILLVVGGVTSIGGALLASFLFAMMPLIFPQIINGALHHVGVGGAFNPDLTIALFGVLLLIGLMRTPNGVVGELDRRLRLLAARRVRGPVRPRLEERTVS
jgi:branched-chain amino acid transport system permease protein